MKHVKQILLPLAVIMVMLTAGIMAPVSYGAEDSINVFEDRDSVEIDANSSMTLVYTVYNNSGADCSIFASAESTNSSVSATVDVKQFILGPSETRAVHVTLKADRFAHAGDYELTVSFYPYSPGNSAQAPVVLSMPMEVTSVYASEGAFNKILGAFDNPFDAPLNAPWVTTLITAILWIIISLAVTTVVVKVSRFIIRVLNKKRKIKLKDKRKKDALDAMGKYVFGIIILHGISNTMRVIGASESLVAIFEDISVILTVIFAAMIVWGLFKAEMAELSLRLREHDTVDDSLIPLILMLGRIVIFFGTAVVVLAVFGIDLVTLITSIGLITTGISLGAKSVIGQFINGMILLIERPFVKGDKIKVAGDQTVLKVEKVGFLTSEFTSWSNEERYIIPNNVLSDSTMVNITRDNKEYKVYDYYSIAYDSNIELAKGIMMDCTYSHPRVIVEGPLGKPEIRFEGTDGSGISLRLSYAVEDHESYGTIGGEIRMAIYKRFTEEGIEIPYTQYTVNVIKTGQADKEE